LKCKCKNRSARRSHSEHNAKRTRATSAALGLSWLARDPARIVRMRKLRRRILLKFIICKKDPVPRLGATSKRKMKRQESE